MDDVTAVLRMIDKLPGGFYTPQKGSAFRPCVKRTRARNDPAIAALLKALQDEHNLAVAIHEHDHGAQLRIAHIAAQPPKFVCFSPRCSS